MMTRSMALKTSSDAGEPVVAPLKIMKSPVPSSSGSSSHSSSPSSYAFPRKLPTPHPKTSFLCEVCRNTSSSLNSNSINVSSSVFPNVKLNEFDRQINLLLNNLECKNELIRNQISRIESAISGHKAIVNALECGISDIANKLNNVSSKLSTFESFVSSFSNVMLNKPSSSNVTLNKSSPPAYPYESFPNIACASSSVSHNMAAKVPYHEVNAPSSRPVTSIPPRKCSLLVVGDSNTKYIKFPNISCHRVPTYLIEDINPSMRIGHAKVWLHVGINNLKSIRCSGLNDLHKAFELFMHKIEQIGRLSSNTTVIVTPILPTGVSVLNDRARAFNRLLFSTRRWFLTLNFSSFADRYSMLDRNYRCYNNPRDKKHLGSQGIRLLERPITQRTFVVDARSYRAVVQSNIT